MALPLITIKIFVCISKNTVAEILSVAIELTLDVIASCIVKAADLVMITNLRGALSEDNVNGTFHDHTHKIGAFLWPYDGRLALSLRAERNDALKLALSLSIREHDIHWHIILLKESEHGYLNRIPPWIIYWLLSFVLHLETSVIVHDNA